MSKKHTFQFEDYGIEMPIEMANEAAKLAKFIDSTKNSVEARIIRLFIGSIIKVEVDGKKYSVIFKGDKNES